MFQEKHKLSGRKHIFHFKQFEWVIYEYAGKEKKKLALVDKNATITDFKTYLHSKMQPFLSHRFNVSHTATMVENLFVTLKPQEIVLIQDFSENYTCLLPD